MQKQEFNYYVNENDRCLYLYVGENTLICTIEDCLGIDEQELNQLADNVLYEHEYLKENEKYFAL